MKHALEKSEYMQSIGKIWENSKFGQKIIKTPNFHRIFDKIL